MPRPGSPGRPGTAVIPPAWEQHHQPVAEGTFTAQCRLRDPAADVEGPFDPDTGTRPVTKAAPYYDGPCRVQQMHTPRRGETAEQQTAEHDYLVQVPKTVTGVREKHRIEIYGSNDAALNGRELHVADVMRGSLTWSRDLVCLDNLGR